MKVVSSMGTQSVGKSFMLNHLVDTSFAGSAMRTTGMLTHIYHNFLQCVDKAFILEGVWMSVTPTQESLIVALDFEGTKSNYWQCECVDKRDK